MITPDLSRALWRKSSRSGDNGGACVEVGPLDDTITAIRDSKNPDGGVIHLTGTAWHQFRANVKCVDSNAL